ncbi:MAG: hypothetical protein CMH52_09610 [Myxococcales bacterium]|nr:hypothetical protein [Myxococcales bacterium]
MNQIKDQFEELDRTTRSSLDRLRSVIYRNKKELEAPIYRNKDRLDRMGKRSTWILVLLILQTLGVVWLLFTHFEMRKQIALLTAAATDLELDTVKSLQKMESDVIYLQKERDSQKK